MADGDALWIGQGGASTLSVGTLLQLAAYMQGKTAAWAKRRVEETSSTNLTFDRHNRSLVSFPNGGTLTAPSFSDCGDGLMRGHEHLVRRSFARDRHHVFRHDDGAAETDRVDSRRSARNGVSAIYAQTPLAPGTSQSISIGALANQLAATAFQVPGRLPAMGRRPR